MHKAKRTQSVTSGTVAQSSSEQFQPRISNTVELIKGRLLWEIVSTEQGSNSYTPSNQYRFNTDQEYVYIPFGKDFGPMHLGQIHRYILSLDQLLNSDQYSNLQLVHFTTSDLTQKTNSAFLIGCYAILKLGAHPDDIWKKFQQHQPYRPYRDPANNTIYEQTIADCWKGLKKACDYGWYSPETFDAKQYYHYSKGENGNIHCIVPNRFIAMNGPYFARVDLRGHRRNIVEDYFEPFKQLGVTTVVRLNTKDYDENKFTSRGFRHLDYYFADGTAPRKELVQRFLTQIELIGGCIAIHCHAGLGRTATMIGAYVIKHFKFLAAEFISWVRICRPGSMHGPQQLLLLELEADLLMERNISMRRLFSQGATSSRQQHNSRDFQIAKSMNFTKKSDAENQQQYSNAKQLLQLQQQQTPQRLQQQQDLIRHININNQLQQKTQQQLNQQGLSQQYQSKVISNPDNIYQRKPPSTSNEQHRQQQHHTQSLQKQSSLNPLVNIPVNPAETIRKTTTVPTLTEGTFKETTPILNRREKAEEPQAQKIRVSTADDREKSQQQYNSVTRKLAQKSQTNVINSNNNSNNNNNILNRSPLQQQQSLGLPSTDWLNQLPLLQQRRQQIFMAETKLPTNFTSRLKMSKMNKPFSAYNQTQATFFAR